MAIEFLWRLPTDGDARINNLDLWNLHSGAGDQVGYFSRGEGYHYARRDGFTYVDHIARVAKAAESTGFDGVLVPASPNADEPWLVAASLIRETQYLRFLPSFHSAIIKPVHAARMLATAQRHSSNRFDWNIVSGDSNSIQKRDGDFAPAQERYRRTGEFLKITRGVLTQRQFTYEGNIYQVENGGLEPPMSNVAVPTVYLSGNSETALDIAANHADVYLTWLEPLPALSVKLNKLRERAAKLGRSLRFGVRVDVIARPEEEDAWSDARLLWEMGDKASLRKLQSTTGDDIDGLSAERTYAAGYTDVARFQDSIISPNVWAGEGVVRPGASITLVGSYQNVAEKLKAYAGSGVDHFILASRPHLEEAYRIGEDLLPLLR